jgi:hypothetical protein
MYVTSIYVLESAMHKTLAQYYIMYVKGIFIPET